MKDALVVLKDTPLYEPIEIGSSDYAFLFDLIYFNRTVDYFCVGCGQESTFEGQSCHHHGSRKIRTFQDFENLHKFSAGEVIERMLFRYPYHMVQLECTRYRDHKSIFLFKVKQGETIEKIGQYPSLASRNLPDIKKYRKVLSSEKYTEFNRAIGLTAHGIGVGAFVYLRRIFEALIGEAHSQVKVTKGWDDDQFLKERMGEKIQMLSDYLPRFLVEHHTMYGILSKGIHELSEEECLKSFPVLKTGIELILDQKLEALQRAEKEKEAARAISILTEKHSNKKK